MQGEEENNNESTYVHTKLHYKDIQHFRFSCTKVKQLEQDFKLRCSLRL